MCVASVARMPMRSDSSSSCRTARQTKRRQQRQAAKRRSTPLSGMRCNFDFDMTENSTSSSSHDDAPPHPAGYMKEGHNRVDDRKGKGSARK
ncbi:hypothetical protein D1007_18796 [Hordeum vulgare]|nr:hypothetical protein D1007_18796 [Hordeum vulgare]